MIGRILSLPACNNSDCKKPSTVWIYLDDEKLHVHNVPKGKFAVSLERDMSIIGFLIHTGNIVFSEIVEVEDDGSD